MKNKGFICVLLTLVLLVCPVAAIGAREEQPEAPAAEQTGDGDTILVLSSSTKKKQEIELFEYVVGAVSAEMPATYHSQALKAQAVACYTYALKARQSPDSSLGGAHISDNSLTHQGYMDKDARKEKWGDRYDDYEKKIEQAVTEVYGKKLTCEGELITAAYHAISSGSTFSAQEVWGRETSYLKPVTSVADRLSPDFSKTVVFTQEQFKQAVSDIENVKLGTDAGDWVGECKTSSSGYIESVQIGGESLSGAQVRRALDLRSAAFEIEYTDSAFRITSYGYGHGVGMSQYGADYMARQGRTWEEILKHYYTGVEIE